MKTIPAILCSVLLCFSTSVYAIDKMTTEIDIPDLLDSEMQDGEEEYYDYSEEVTINDPLEPVNRMFFKFNDKLYDWVMKPVTDGYTWVVPEDLRESFGSAFQNLGAPVRLLNSLLQGELKQSGIVLERFLINSTIGVLGLVDIASKEFDLQPTKADFGQTLGKWGAGEGIYICWPFLGPSSVRDGIGLAVDAYTHPIPYLYNDLEVDLIYYSVYRINDLSLNPDIYEDLRKYSVDPYAASRQAYYEYRKAMIEKK
ncbi:MlaA family lipoprotein [Desulforhopalus singaporensis]|uniref:Phospholipid-binding lipoprotein MlaA n=1 Tax=Desulforhopalus singaporensis TaxID=91360 RepID=A0A1H0J4X5_9BACT|nr:VacJ family lipoprotein [Desulforhopalus singaporensis]SDO38509.1 phospholipid-binding lipoprotein MlaA [Desulforhopalus singaporensis]